MESQTILDQGLIDPRCHRPYLLHHAIPQRITATRCKSVIAAEFTIFIVDDNELELESLRRVISSAGYKRIETFRSAEEFLDRAILQGPCLLILNLVSPTMSGLCLHRQLRQTGYTLRTVFVSASQHELERATGECMEALAFLKKPFEAHDLITTMRAASQD